MGSLFYFIDLEEAKKENWYVSLGIMSTGIPPTTHVSSRSINISFS